MLKNKLYSKSAYLIYTKDNIDIFCPLQPFIFLKRSVSNCFQKFLQLVLFQPIDILKSLNNQFLIS